MATTELEVREWQESDGKEERRIKGVSSSGYCWGHLGRLGNPLRKHIKCTSDLSSKGHEARELPSVSISQCVRECYPHHTCRPCCSWVEWALAVWELCSCHIIRITSHRATPTGPTGTYHLPLNQTNWLAESLRRDGEDQQGLRWDTLSVHKHFYHAIPPIQVGLR